MPFTFDLISDLHHETWNNFDWTGQATSPFAVVAGDIALDREQLLDTLQHLSKCYHMVFYIDGNDEHKLYMSDLAESYRNLNRSIKKMKNVVYLQENVVVLNGVALLATNGWWGFDADETIDEDQTQHWWLNKMFNDGYDACSDLVKELSRTDAAYIIRSVQKLQRHQDVKKIVIVTHTVPRKDLIDHDIDLVGNYRFNTMVNSLMNIALANDTEHKIHTWCFGHYHMPVDRVLDNVRYVNNCRGRGDTDFKQSVFFPKRIEIS
jgi:UDP-2,3-diacylglucosamine pyrophosphatase LpxH